MWILTEG